jgi:NitT/TauT family transport system ATP-binding protein
MDTIISVRELRKEFDLEKGRKLLVLDKISFEVSSGSLTTIIGFSGSGKSTLLNLLAGIEPVTSGSIQLASNGSGKPSRIGYVFQNARLLPWLTIEDNLMFVRNEDVAVHQHRQRVQKYLQMVGLEGAEKKFPYQLSGGMQQRAGIARALCVEPAVLLMDEPFSHLDEITAEVLRQELMRIWEETRRTILFVTHDIHEAVELGDRMIILGRRGKIYDDLDIPLPRPRDISDPEFVRVHTLALGSFRRMQMEMVEEVAGG